MLAALAPAAAAVQTISTVAHGTGAPEAVAADSDGRALVAAGGRIYRLYEWNADPEVLAGTGTKGYSGDGGPAVQAQLGTVGAILRLWNGTIVFTDTQNHRIRQIDAGGVITTLAGNGSATPSGDGGAATAAGLPAPVGLAQDNDGNFYVSTGNRIRKIRTDGVIEAFAGADAAGYDDGAWVLANVRMDRPGALAMDGFPQHLVVADRGNRRIRLVRPDGWVTAFAGNGGSGYAGGSTAALATPLGEVSGMAVAGGIYATLPDSHRVVYIAGGTVMPFAGTGISGYAGDGAAPALANLSAPGAVAYLESTVNPGVTLIADSGNARVRRIGSTNNQPQIPTAPIAEARDASVWLDFRNWTSPSTIAPLRREIRVMPGARILDVVTEPYQMIEGLDNGTSYTFAMRAIYPGGPSPWSPESNAVTPFAPQVPSIADVSMVEGNAGTRDMVFTISVPQPVPAPLSVYLTTVDSGTASGEDFSATPIYGITIPTGQTSATFTVRVNGDLYPETDEYFTVELKDGSVVTYASARGTILNDDGAPDLDFYGVPDRYTHNENGGALALNVLANDKSPRSALDGGRLEIVGSPANGSLAVSNGGTPADAADDVLTYTPKANWSGVDALAYRACSNTGACYDEMATVRVSLGYWPAINTPGQSGRSGPVTARPRALSNVRFASTPLVKTQSEVITVPPDLRPSSPWDAGREGTVTRLYTLPAPGNGQPAEWQVTVDVGRFGFDPMRTYVGVDANGDGQPSADEVRCTGTMGLAEEFCDFPLRHPGTGEVRYWVMLHNPALDMREADVHVAAVPMVEGDGKLVATGQSSVAAGGTLTYMASYNDPTVLQSEPAIGYVRVMQGDQEVDRLPSMIYVDAEISTNSGAALANGEAHALRLSPGHAHDRLFIDVPAGATSLAVTTASAANVDLYLAKASPAAATASIGTAPARASAQAWAATAGGNESVLVEGAALTPGRWYVTPVNSAAGIAALTVTATITNTTAPVVRPGSYFNASRAGHGIFLYPAGDQWAGLWYTYEFGGRPTWYYAQGARPGADGIWRADLYNSVWTGSGNRLTKIGRVMVTATGPDAFTFTHEVQGLTGSQPMQSLGRGCPVFGTLPVDASSHWFNPATAGSGYSVQLWSNYEFYAAFVYDGQGFARYLVAERSGFGGGDAVLTLEQLRGTPPTSVWQGTPTRFPAGTLRRVVSGSKLSRVDVSASFVDGVPGTWSSVDAVQPLGGAGTTQGCLP